MKLTIVTTVLLGLLLTPTFADIDWDTEGNQHSNGNHQLINEPVLNSQIIRKKISIDGGYQTLTLHRQQHIATIQQESSQGSWETIWNYNSGIIATKVLPQRVCYISKVNRMELPLFDELPRLAGESMSVNGQSQPAKEITFVIQRPIHDLRSYGQHVFTMCSGLPTYEAYEVQGPQNNQYIQESCLSMGLLQLLGLQYCHAFDYFEK